MKIGLDFAAHSDPSRNAQFSRRWVDPPQRSSALAAEIVSDPKFQRQVEHVHNLGPRVVGELLAEIGAVRGIRTLIDQKLNTYCELDPKVIEAAEAAGFWSTPLRQVRP